MVVGPVYEGGVWLTHFYVDLVGRGVLLGGVRDELCGGE